MSAVMPRHRRRRTVVAVALLAVSWAPALSAAADPPHPKPSSGSDLRQQDQKLQQARARARADEHELDTAKQRVNTANAELAARAAAAEESIDRYAATLREVAKARKHAAARQAVAAVAAARVDHQQQRVQAFARAAYMSGGPMTSLAIVLSADAPRAILNRAALIGQVSESQATVLRALAKAQERQAAAVAKAEAAERAVEQVAARADAQRRSALMSMADQQSLLKSLTTEAAKASARVAAQRTQVAQLARERAAARAAEVARQRAALAAAWAAMRDVGESMPWATKEQGRQVVDEARKFLGTPYSWGGGNAKGPTLGWVNEEGNPAGLYTRGFDCSGLALYAWGRVGFTLDHYTGYQWVEGHHVALSNLRAGDLVFFASDVSDPLTIHHVGIYVRGDRMIDAPHTGADVRYDKVFVPGLIGAVRP
jgi:cell wall-associated NlpC family hydrolase